MRKTFLPFFKSLKKRNF